MSEPTVVIGPPGTGKTTFILNKIEEYLDNDVEIITQDLMTQFLQDLEI